MHRNTKWIIAMLIAFAVWAFVRSAHASGPVPLKFQQTQDCSLVDHWDAFAAKGTVNGGDPSGLKIGTVPNTGGTVCVGSAIVSVTEPVVGVGVMTFWLVAVAADGTTSVASNTKALTLPLAAPVLVSVGP